MSFIDPTLLGGRSTQPTNPTSSGPAPLNGTAADGAAGPSGTTGEDGDVEQVQEMHQKDQELAQFLLQLDHFQPLIPDALITFYLERVGFTSTDPRLKRLLALAAQKFVADIAQDAYSFARTRAGQAPGGRAAGPSAPAAPGAGTAGPGQQSQQSKKDRARTTLTQEDLAQALAEFGINAHRAPYYL